MSDVATISQTPIAPQNLFQQRRTDFRALGSALQSGDLTGAQTAFSALLQDDQAIRSSWGSQHGQVSGASQTGSPDDTSVGLQTTLPAGDPLAGLQAALRAGTSQGLQAVSLPGDSQGLKTITQAGDSQGPQTVSQAGGSQGLQTLSLPGDSQGLKTVTQAGDSSEIPTAPSTMTQDTRSIRPSRHHHHHHYGQWAVMPASSDTTTGTGTTGAGFAAGGVLNVQA